MFAGPEIIRYTPEPGFNTTGPRWSPEKLPLHPRKGLSSRQETDH
jgi:hypothetical protein